MIKLLRWSVLIVCMAFANAHGAPILQVDGTGKLTGATGVDIGGTLYDVEFLDGTCIALFSGCDAPGDFTFNHEAGALAASTALLTQVFLDVLAGNFDTNPGLTRGCTPGFPFQCIAITPWAGLAIFIPTVIAANLRLESEDTTDITVLLTPFFDSTGDSSTTWAIWSPAVQPTPAPGTIAILGAGLLALILTRRRRNS
jgi:hypothetical protein